MCLCFHIVIFYLDNSFFFDYQEFDVTKNPTECACGCVNKYLGLLGMKIKPSGGNLHMVHVCLK